MKKIYLIYYEEDGKRIYGGCGWSKYEFKNARVYTTLGGAKLAMAAKNRYSHRTNKTWHILELVNELRESDFTSYNSKI